MSSRNTSSDTEAEQETRRQETIAGHKITIITRGEIETARGGPKCGWCGKALRPSYQTDRAPVETKHYFDHEPKNVKATFDKSRNQWVVVSTAYRVVKRTFLGSFGAYKDNHFCGLNCGRDFGLAVAEALTRKQCRVVNKSGKEIAFSKDGQGVS